MRLLLIKQEILPKGGLEKYTKMLTEAFVKTGCDVTVATATPNIDTFAGAKVIHLPLKGLFGFQRINKWDHLTRSFATKNSFDRIFTPDRITSPTHIRAGNGVHAAFLKRRQDHFIKRCSFQINPLHRTILNLERKSFTSPSLHKIFALSNMVKCEIEEFYNIDPSKISVHHNGVEWREMAFPFSSWEETREAMLNKLQLPKDQFYFLFVGHHYKRKGLDYLLEGLARIPEGHLLVVGKEKKLAYYQKMVRVLGLQNRVHFLEEQKDIVSLYSTADALVIPSLYDPFANVTVEALAMGLYVVCSKFTGGSEVIPNDQIIEDLFDPDSVAQSLSQAILHKKTAYSAKTTRMSVSGLDFSIQLPRFIKECLA